MKIKDVISEDADAGSTVSGVVATAPAGNLFAVPMKRNMPRKRPKKEAEELTSKKDKKNVIEHNG